MMIAALFLLALVQMSFVVEWEKLKRERVARGFALLS